MTPAPLRLSRGTIGLLLLLGAVALVACGGGERDLGAPDRPKIAVTTGILADITRQVTGDRVEIVQVIPDGVDAHDFQLSAKGRAEVEDSQLLIYNGGGLEAGIPVDSFSIDKWALVDHVGPLIEVGEDHHGEDDHGDGDSHSEESSAHGSADPHVWMDPDRIVTALPALVAALTRSDRTNRGKYRTGATRYSRALEALVSEMKRDMDPIPAERRKLVTSHDAMAYFASRFGFEILAAPFPSTGAESEASAEAISEVEAQIEESGVPAVFPESESSPAVLEMIAQRTGVKVISGLLVESTGDSGSYLEMMRTDARLIASGLRG